MARTGSSAGFGAVKAALVAPELAFEAPGYKIRSRESYVMVRKVNQPMSAQIKESDWKVFKEISPIALNRFCGRILSELRRAADDSAKSPHERYLAIYKLIERRDKEMADAFNDFRRSTAFFQVGIMYALGALEEEEFGRFSQEMQDLVRSLYTKGRRG